jgi:hypothetical protein
VSWIWFVSVWFCLGITLTLIIDKHAVLDTVFEGIGLVLTWLVWPLLLVHRMRRAAAVRAYNLAAAVRRADGQAANALKHDFEAWWSGADLRGEYRMVIGGRRARTWEEIKLARRDV